MAADSAGQEYCGATGGLLDSALPAARVIRAELHHAGGEHRGMRAVASQHNNSSIGLLQHDIAELGVHFSQRSHQTVADEIRRLETAMTQSRGFEVRDRIANRSHN